MRAAHHASQVTSSARSEKDDRAKFTPSLRKETPSDQDASSEEHTFTFQVRQVQDALEPYLPASRTRCDDDPEIAIARRPSSGNWRPYG
jgi:hypothetical protein